MLTPQDARNMLFTTKYPPDKVVDVITGIFSAAGGFTTTNHAVSHSFGVPVLLQMIWSVDGVTWYDQGGGISDLSSPTMPVFDTITANCYSTSAQNVIVAKNNTAGGVTIQYVAACIWDDLQSHVISVVPPPAGAGDTGFLFTTRHNLPKIYLDGSVSPSVPVSGGPPVTYDPTTVTHGLGYVPDARVWYEPVAGQVWPLAGIDNDVFGRYYLTTTALVVELANLSAGPQVTPVRYRVYTDE